MIDWLEEVLREEERGSLPEALKLTAGGLVRPAVRETGAEALSGESGETDGLSLNEGEDGFVLSSDLRRWAEEPEVAGVRKGLSLGGSSSGVRRLYRRMAQAVAVTLAAVSVPGVIREEQGAQSAGLTVRELDRAVRRDSRRYDGGMSIY